MKKTLLKATMLAAIASLVMSGSVLAHHPLFTVNPDQFEVVDDMMGDNSNHDNVVGDVEDYEFMGNVSQSMDSVGGNSTTDGGSMEASQDSAGAGTGGDMTAAGTSSGPGNAQSRR